MEFTGRNFRLPASQSLTLSLNSDGRMPWKAVDVIAVSTLIDATSIQVSGEQSLV